MLNMFLYKLLNLKKINIVPYSGIEYLLSSIGGHFFFICNYFFKRSLSVYFYHVNFFLRHCVKSQMSLCKNNFYSLQILKNGCMIFFSVLNNTNFKRLKQHKIRRKKEKVLKNFKNAKLK